MDETELGMITDVILESLTNAFGSFLTFGPMVNEVIFDVLIPILLQSIAFHSSMEGAQSVNAFGPTEFNDLPIVSAFNPVQPLKAQMPIEVTASGILIPTKLEQL